MRYGTSVISGVILLLTGAIALYTYGQVGALSEMQKGAFEFAILYLAVLGVCSFGAMLTGVAEGRLAAVKKAVMPEAQFFLFGLTCAGYLLVLTLVGWYLPSTIVALSVAMMVLGVKPLHAAAVSLLFSLVIYGAFSGLLSVPLP